MSILGIELSVVIGGSPKPVWLVGAPKYRSSGARVVYLGQPHPALIEVEVPIGDCTNWGFSQLPAAIPLDRAFHTTSKAAAEGEMAQWEVLSPRP